MRKTILWVAIFLSGTVAGALAVAGVVGRHWHRTFADRYILELADQAFVAREIYAGNAEELAGRIRSKLPAYVRAVETDFPGGLGREWAYWVVADVYLTSGEAVPMELQTILSTLPPRPSCAPPRRRDPVGKRAEVAAGGYEAGPAAWQTEVSRRLRWVAAEYSATVQPVCPAGGGHLLSVESLRSL